MQFGNITMTFPWKKPSLLQGRSVSLAIVGTAALSILAACSSDDAPSEARTLACKIAYSEELQQADQKFMQDSADFREQSTQEGIPTRLSIRVQESFNNNREYIKARASRKLETCLTTGYYEQPSR